jgi:hypothetical protein
MRFMLIVGLAVVGFCGEAQAWGDEGHKIVCEIAFRLAQPDTRAAVRKLIRSDTEFDTCSESCVFPDHPRKRASEHFINLPRNTSGLTSDDCPAADKERAYRDPERFEDFGVQVREAGRPPHRAEVSGTLGRRYPPAASCLVRGRPRRQQYSGGRRMCRQPARYLGQLPGSERSWTGRRRRRNRSRRRNYRRNEDKVERF